MKRICMVEVELFLMSNAQHTADFEAKTTATLSRFTVISGDHNRGLI